MLVHRRGKVCQDSVVILCELKLSHYLSLFRTKIFMVPSACSKDRGPGLRSVLRWLKLVFLKRFERRRAAAQDVVAGDTVEDMDAMVVQQGGLGHGPFGAGAALLALLERFGADFLDRFEAVAFGALVFVKRHDRC